MTPFERAVRATVRAIPKGTTLSYAGVALRAGKPGAARAVVRALHRSEGIPWWRVIRSDGTLAAQVATDQARRLADEGVRFTPNGKPQGAIARGRRAADSSPAPQKSHPR